MGQLGGQPMTGRLGSGDQRHLGGGVGAGRQYLGLLAFDDRYSLACGQLAGDVLHHRLQGLAFHVQGLLADGLPALFQVADRQYGRHGP